MLNACDLEENVTPFILIVLQCRLRINLIKQQVITKLSLKESARYRWTRFAIFETYNLLVMVVPK